MRSTFRLIVIAIFAQAGFAFGSDCVTGITLMSNKRGVADMAASNVTSVDLFENVAQCNRRMRSLADGLTGNPKIHSLPADSLTFECVVPEDCYPDDRTDNSPLSVVLPIGKYRRSAVIEK